MKSAEATSPVRATTGSTITPATSRPWRRKSSVNASASFKGSTNEGPSTPNIFWCLTDPFTPSAPSVSPWYPMVKQTMRDRPVTMRAIFSA